MVAVSEGQEVSLDDEHSWSAISLLRGQVVEVFFAASSFQVQSESWGAFLVTNVANLLDGSILADVKFVGSEDSDVFDAAVPLFNQSKRRLHLCLTRPCVDPTDEEKLHVTRVRLWTLSGFRGCDYITDEMWLKLDEWIQELSPPPGARGELGEKAPKSRRKPKDVENPAPKRVRTPRTTTTPTAPRSKAKPDGASSTRRTPKSRAEEVDDGAGEALTEEKKQALRDKLKKIRGVLTKGGDPTEKVSSEEDPEGFQLVGSSPEKSPCALEDMLTSGTGLDCPKTGLEKSETRRKGALRRKAEEVTKGSSSKSLRKQLAQRAVEVAEQRTRKKKDKKEGSSDVKKLSHNMLTKILTKGSESSSKKGRKKRKLKNGVIETCSGCSSESTEESDKASSEEDLEAPIKKKSRDHPGSV